MIGTSVCVDGSALWIAHDARTPITNLMADVDVTMTTRHPQADHRVARRATTALAAADHAASIAATDPPDATSGRRLPAADRAATTLPASRAVPVAPARPTTTPLLIAVAAATPAILAIRVSDPVTARCALPAPMAGTRPPAAVEADARPPTVAGAIRQVARRAVRAQAIWIAAI